MNEIEILSFRDRHRFSLMIVFAILISATLVAISIALYYNSGASQLDLSRPGYKNVRAQVKNDENGFNSFSSTGAIDQSAITEFNELFLNQAKKVKDASAFSGDPLNPDALGLTVN